VTNILNLPGFEVVSVEHNKHDYHIQARYTKTPEACMKCGTAPPNLYRHATKEQRFFDTPMHNRRVGVYVQRQRWRCKDCGGTFMEELPGMDDSRAATARLLHFIRDKCFVEPFTKIAEEVGITEGTVRNIFKDYVQEMEARYQFATPEFMGIDEAHLMNDMRCVITNLGQRAIVDILPYRDQATVIRRLSRMDNREKVVGVSIDMWRPYLEAVKICFPQAVVVVDKFHVVSRVGHAAEEIRKAVRAALEKPARQQLRGDVHLMRTRRHRLRPEQRLIVEAWYNGFPQLGKAYDLKESFYEIYDAADRPEAEERFEAWKNSIPEDLWVVFGPVAKMVDNWYEYIFAYWDHRITNAYTEAVNRTLKELNRRGRGYSFEVLRARVLYRGAYVAKKPKFGRHLVTRKPAPHGLILYGRWIGTELKLSRQPHFLENDRWALKA
jgi:transposase